MAAMQASELKQMIEQLEDYIDRVGVASILSELAGIAEAKGEHLRVNWQDGITAKVWERDATILYKASGAIKSKAAGR